MARGNSRAQSEIGASSVIGADVFGSGRKYWGNMNQDAYFSRLSDDVALPGLRAENIRLREEYDKATEAFKAEQDEISRIGLKVHKEALEEAAESVIDDAFAKPEYADILAQSLGLDNAKQWLTSSFNLDGVKPDQSKQRLADIYAERMAGLIAGRVPKGSDAPGLSRDVKGEKTEAYYKVQSKRLEEDYQKLGVGPYVPKEGEGAGSRSLEAGRQQAAGPLSLVLGWRAKGLSADVQRAKFYAELHKSFDSDTGRFNLPPARQAAIFNGLKRTIGKGSSDLMRDYVGKLTEGQRKKFKNDLSMAQDTWGVIDD